MRLKWTLAWLGAIVVMLGLPVGVVLTALLLEDVRTWPWVWIGLVPLLGGTLVAHYAWPTHHTASTAGEDSRVTFGNCTLTVFDIAATQAITLLLFGSMLDSGIHLRACWYTYLGYAAGAIVILVRRRNALTPGDRFYLAWAWMPIIVIGTPLIIHVWKVKGLI